MVHRQRDTFADRPFDLRLGPLADAGLGVRRDIGRVRFDVSVALQWIGKRAQPRYQPHRVVTLDVHNIRRREAELF